MKTNKLVNCPQCGGFGFTSTPVSTDYKITVCRAKTCELCHGSGVIEVPMPCKYCHESKNIYEIKSKLHDSMNTEIYITGESLVVDIGCHSYGTAEIKFCPMCGRNLREGADNGS